MPCAKKTDMLISQQYSAMTMRFTRQHRSSACSRIRMRSAKCARRSQPPKTVSAVCFPRCRRRLAAAAANGYLKDSSMRMHVNRAIPKGTALSLLPEHMPLPSTGCATREAWNQASFCSLMPELRLTACILQILRGLSPLAAILLISSVACIRWCLMRSRRVLRQRNLVLLIPISIKHACVSWLKPFIHGVSCR